MPRKRSEVTSVTADLPLYVDLAKLKSGKSLEFRVKVRRGLLGTLYIGRGSIEWWPKGHYVNKVQKTWIAFAKMFDPNKK